MELKRAGLCAVAVNRQRRHHGGVAKLRSNSLVDYLLSRHAKAKLGLDDDEARQRPCL
jgi:hypothetical protein